MSISGSLSKKNRARTLSPASSQASQRQKTIFLPFQPQNSLGTEPWMLTPTPTSVSMASGRCLPWPLQPRVYRDPGAGRAPTRTLPGAVGGCAPPAGPHPPEPLPPPEGVGAAQPRIQPG